MKKLTVPYVELGPKLTAEQLAFFDREGAILFRNLICAEQVKEIIAETDLNGKQGNFLASVDDYEFVRGLQRKNLIIPVVGDFAGKKALAGVGEYLR